MDGILMDGINGRHFRKESGRKENYIVCVYACLSVCVNETPTLIFYVRTLSDVSSLIWMPLMDGCH
jgi:hypothetical protein